MQFLKCLLLPVLALFLALPLAAADKKQDPNFRFGLPAVVSSDDREAYPIQRPQYFLSYNGTKRTPNWVCWRLRHEDIGKAARGPFVPDPELASNFAKVTAHIYDGSGFDRGHMCPAQDRSATQADMDATF
jgi:endonuclease G